MKSFNLNHINQDFFASCQGYFWTLDPWLEVFCLFQGWQQQAKPSHLLWTWQTNFVQTSGTFQWQTKQQPAHYKKMLELHISADHKHVTLVHFICIISTLKWHIWTDFVIRERRGWWKKCRLDKTPSHRALQTSFETNKKQNWLWFSESSLHFKRLFSHQTRVFISKLWLFSEHLYNAQALVFFSDLWL